MRYLLGIVLLFIVVACNKSNNGSISLKIASVNGSFIPIDGSLQVIFNFTDNGSTIDTLGMIKVRLNQDQITTLRDSLYYGVPGYPASTKGQLQLDLDYQNDLISAESPPSIDSIYHESDTLILRFFAKDGKGLTSDTVNSGTIIVQR